MKFVMVGKYSAHSDCSRYTITWGDKVPPYHAAIRGNPREVFGGSLGSHDSRQSAKAACIAHAAKGAA